MKRLGLVILVACNTPTPTLKLQLAGPPTQDCSQSGRPPNCADVRMTCATVMSIRIADPSDTTAPYLSQCVDVPLDSKQDLCSIASVDLDAKPIPVRTLEVQVALYPRAVIPTDPITGELQCPTKVEYDRVWGFPVDQTPTPALGGHTFYHPGDSNVVVTLGCTNLPALDDPSCAAARPITINATVEDFEILPLSVAPSIADRLTVAVGEPQPGTGVAFELNPVDVRALTRTAVASPAWSSDVALTFNQHLCLEVLEDGAQSTASLSCKMATTAVSYDLQGVRLAKATLTEILGTLGLTAFPDDGLTIGIVLDDLGKPASNFKVAATNGTVQYLSADRKTVIPGTATSASGIWVSRDAPFGTVFSTGGLGLSEITGVGGLVQGKVTVVVLQFEKPATM